VSFFLEPRWGLSGGVFSHVLIDAFHREHNPLFFPFTSDSFNGLVFMNDWTSASIVVPLAFLSVLIIFMAMEVRRGTENVWIRLFVE